MTDPPRPRILILESNRSISDHAVTILTREGFDVHCETASKQALLRLEASKSAPFHLFISSFKLPKMKGDDILKHAKKISPMTQRMLMVPADEPDMVIRAINKGGIHSCIIYPFQDEDLVNQAKNCLVQFRRSMKRRQLKRITTHQNQQLFQIAQKLKKKNEACQRLIAEKKAKKLMRNSILRKALKQKAPDKEISLGIRLDQNDIPVTPDALNTEFLMLCDYIKALFDATASKANLDPVALDFPPPDLKDATAAPTQDPDSGPATASPAPPPSDLVQKVLTLALTSQPGIGVEATLKPVDEGDQLQDTSLNAYIQLSLSRDMTRASIQRIKGMDLSPITLSTLLVFLRDQDIVFGIVEDKALEEGISHLTTEDHSLLVASGKEPIAGKDGSIEFYFENDFTNPGKIQENGTIDFRDRGGIPYVGKEELLAEKTPAIEGENGMDVFGNPILIDAPLDPVLISGSGTHTNEDGLEIYATLDGQPHADAMGNITVNPELMINGDVDFETGNIDFNGNIIVRGIIKEGFTIKGMSLTAQEIEGADIELSGDLYISDGITEAKIHSVGNVHAKFINHSIVAGFGDLIIQREIIDSDIVISGACQNKDGHIIASKIIAKQGIEAGKIGTAASKPSVLKVGVDEHIEILTRKIQTRLDNSLARLKEVKEKIKLIETQDQELYEQITQKAQIQDKAQNEFKELGQTVLSLKKDNDVAGLQKASIQLKKLSKIAETAEQELNKIFETQDLYANQIYQLKEQTTHIENQNKRDVLEKKGLKEFADKTSPLPRILINKKITQDNAIFGPNTSITIREDLSRCQIQEKAMMEEGQYFYEMDITDL
jgi:uncharacterized protein